MYMIYSSSLISLSSSPWWHIFNCICCIIECIADRGEIPFWLSLKENPILHFTCEMMIRIFQRAPTSSYILDVLLLPDAVGYVQIISGPAPSYYETGKSTHSRW